MHPYALSAVLTLTLALFIFLLRSEAKRGSRVLPGFRNALDRGITSLRRYVAAHMPRLDRHYFRQLFHLIVHLALSALLWCTTRIERQIKRVARLNRSSAQIARAPKSDSHLGKVLAHKETIALSEEEKGARREAALRGDSEGR